MLNWAAILNRILRLYGVQDHQALGVVLGIPVSMGFESSPADAFIPWRILELVVAEKKVSWDWLLTGKEYREDNDGAGEADPDSPPAKTEEMFMTEQMLLELEESKAAIQKQIKRMTQIISRRGET